MFEEIGSLWSAETVAVLETTLDAPGRVKIEIVAVPAFAIVPSASTRVTPSTRSRGAPKRWRSGPERFAARQAPIVGYAEVEWFQHRKFG